MLRLSSMASLAGESWHSIRRTGSDLISSMQRRPTSDLPWMGFEPLNVHGFVHGVSAIRVYIYTDYSNHQVYIPRYALEEGSCVQRKIYQNAVAPPVCDRYFYPAYFHPSHQPELYTVHDRVLPAKHCRHNPPARHNLWVHGTWNSTICYRRPGRRRPVCGGLFPRLTSNDQRPFAATIRRFPGSMLLCTSAHTHAPRGVHPAMCRDHGSIAVC